MPEPKPHLAYTVAVDPPGQTGCRLMAKMLAASLRRTQFFGDVRIFHNSTAPIFFLERKGVKEVCIEPETPEDRLDLAKEAWKWKYRVRKLIDAERYVRAQLALLQEALKDAANTHFVFHSESCIPIRPFRDFTKLLSIDGRSRFGWSRRKEIQEQKGDPGKADRALAVPKITPGVWRFHSQWILLNREAAELVVEDDFTSLFENVFAPDECYFGTVLNMKGYPLETKVAAKDITWVNWNNATGGHPNDYGSIDSAQAGAILGSSCYFARKFRNGSNVKDFGLHEAARGVESHW